MSAVDELTDEDPTNGGTGDGGTDDGTQVWREVELELVDGDRELFDAVDARLRAAGLEVAGTGSKLARVLSGARPAPAPQAAQPPAGPSTEPEPEPEPARVSPADRVLTPAAPRRTDLGPGSRAGDVLVAHLAEQVQRILDQDPRVRADEPDSVHAMRVATRRLRSALKTYGSLLTTPTKPVRDELRWLAAELGAARDAEVLRDRLVQSVASLDHAPEEQPTDPAATGAVPQLVREQLEGTTAPRTTASCASWTPSATSRSSTCCRTSSNGRSCPTGAAARRARCCRSGC